MDKELFVQNVRLLCLQKKIKPTTACKEAGVGGSFISDINRGQTPSVAKVQLLADYLGVTTSELLGETMKPATENGDGLTEQQRLMIQRIRRMNDAQLTALENLLDSIDRLKGQ